MQITKFLCKWLSIVVLSLALAACNRNNESSQKNNKKAPQSGGYLSDTIGRIDQTKRRTFQIQVDQAIRMYKAENQSLPESLDEVDNVPELPEGWEWIYNPKTGKAIIGERH